MILVQISSMFLYGVQFVDGVVMTCALLPAAVGCSESEASAQYGGASCQSQLHELE